jgi:mitochondrial import receptor subunit TOM40
MFDGMKVDFSKGLSPHFQINHSFHLGSQVLPSAYTFGAVYAVDQNVSARPDCDKLFV